MAICSNGGQRVYILKKTIVLMMFRVIF
uniref:Uncharacterized protein n=1 Tax=Anguilla anguilla TaxID=7936 RepID=A0A0E9WSI2_ANGAN